MEAQAPKQRKRSTLWIAGAVVIVAVAIVVVAVWTLTKPPAPAVGAISAYTLDNGLKVIVYQDTTAPVVSVNVWYRVGSKDEPTGKRGMAHLMEHMAYKGSKNVGPEEHSKLIDQAGGQDNAFTRDDVTGYWARLPKEKLDLALYLFAEQMHNLVLTQEHLDSEREVVKEEWRLRLENQPVSKAFDKFRDIAFAGTPYAKGPEGYMEDLDNITLEDLQNFYQTYYAPNNAVLVVAGDVRPDEVLSLVQEALWGDSQGSNSVADSDHASPTDADARGDSGDGRAVARHHRGVSTARQQPPRSADPRSRELYSLARAELAAL
jgi:predicted Zn-dependent peptidase